MVETTRDDKRRDTKLIEPLHSRRIEWVERGSVHFAPRLNANGCGVSSSVPLATDRSSFLAGAAAELDRSAAVHPIPAQIPPLFCHAFLPLQRAFATHAHHRGSQTLLPSLCALWLCGKGNPRWNTTTSAKSCIRPCFHLE
jgi:hypothetical protein